ncbi:MAG: magnesium transporter CorA family protein [Beijerinckiaceae bacterium]|nr:magnesium transporter CorA family protein [Beijerinckiaceae bacterium]
MLSFHTPCKARLPSAGATAIPAGVSWIDALRPSEPEIVFLERTLGIEVPTLEDLSEIETSSRLRSEKDWLYLSIPMVYRQEGFMPALTPLGFAMSKDMLLTVRFKHLKPFDALQDNIPRFPMQPGGAGALAAILESIVEHAADMLEGVGGELDGVSEEIFGAEGGANGQHRPREDSERLRLVMRKIGRYGDLTSKLEDLLLGLSRLLPYVMVNAAAYIDSGLRARFKSLQRDVASLNDYETHLTGKVHFLLDAVLGQTNIEQNNIFRILTVVSVIGIPPTFFASLWGMNFKFMPDLDWSFGYAYAIAVIALSAIVPAIWFKKNGWW